MPDEDETQPLAQFVPMPELEEEEILETSRPSIVDRLREQVGQEFQEAPAIPEKPKNDLADLFQVPQQSDADVDTSDLFTVPDENDRDMKTDDLTDLPDDFFDVPMETIMGRPPKPRPQRVMYRQTSKRYNPPTSMGGIR